MCSVIFNIFLGIVPSIKSVFTADLQITYLPDVEAEDIIAT